MEFNVVLSHYRDQAAVISARGGLDLSSFVDMRDFCKQILEKTNMIIINLMGLSHLDSTGLQVLRDVSKEIENKKGFLALIITPDSRVDIIFKIISPDKKFNVFPSEDLALEAIQEHILATAKNLTEVENNENIRPQ